MGETTNKETVKPERKTSVWKTLKAEFKKIIWPDKKSLVKQSVSVIIISVVLGGVIALLDLGIQYVINLIL